MRVHPPRIRGTDNNLQEKKKKKRKASLRSSKVLSASLAMSSSIFRLNRAHRARAVHLVSSTAHVALSPGPSDIYCNRVRTMSGTRTLQMPCLDLLLLVLSNKPLFPRLRSTFLNLCFTSYIASQSLTCPSCRLSPNCTLFEHSFARSSWNKAAKAVLLGCIILAFNKIVACVLQSVKSRLCTINEKNSASTQSCFIPCSASLYRFCPLPASGRSSRVRRYSRRIGILVFPRETCLSIISAKVMLTSLRM